MAGTDLTALPVSLDLPRALHADVQRHLEGAMGWQVTTSADLPARLHLRGVRHARATAPELSVPTVLLVAADDDPGEAARAAMHAQAVMTWPDQADTLPSVARTLLSTRETSVPTLRLAGAGGGVGTTTVALALAGLLGWRGLSVLLVSRSDVPVPEVAVAGTLRGPRPWEVATPVPSVPGVRAVRAPDGSTVEVTGPDLVVDDGGPAPAHLLVAIADRAGLRAVEASEAGAVILVERGPLEVARIVGAAGTRLAARLPWSDRVARAGLLGRVPTSLPGSWLGQLAGLADRIGQDVHSRVGVVRHGGHLGP